MSAESWSVTGPQTIDLEGVSSLKAGIVAGRLDVLVQEDAADASGTAARIEVTEVSGDPISVSLEGGRLEVRHQRHGAQGWFKNLMGTVAGTSENHAVVSISVPAGTAVEMGTVSADGLVSGARPLTRLNTVSGSIMADGTSGQLHISTVSGEVIARGHEGVLTSRTVSGEVTASGDLRHVRANSVSGDLAFDSSGFCEDLGANTVSGDLTIRLPHDVGVDLSANTASGRIVVDDQRFSPTGGKLTAILGPDAKLMLMRANTVSGNISVVHRLEDPTAPAAPEGAMG
ncbi:DUF4097 family beta strand repeat-containing protein [Sinomonas mesophila]|uniref:DUF4097 family beta strand repeat-containing protein n=1 Tax=Sinomonas mesophila TaxID=1531955 RepID=UPI0009847804|nr:DUF4097 family beta strand repeat-containing protein [Sinomonas mesophila]